jgi:hypothetical protein
MFAAIHRASSRVTARLLVPLDASRGGQNGFQVGLSVNLR